MTDDIDARLAHLEDLSAQRLHDEAMAKLAPARLGDGAAPSDPVTGASPFDIPTLIATGIVDWSSLAPSLIVAPTISLGSAAATGVANSLIRSDATIAAFDTTAPSTQAFGDAAAVGTAAKAARRDHKHAMMADPVPTHEAASDPHTGYQKESEKGAASGYASLDGSTLVPTAQLGTGTADATTFLRGDRTYASPTASQVSRDATSATADYVARIRLGTDTTYRAILGLDASDRGALTFGPGGSTAVDTNLYRSGANVLKTDDALEVASGASFGGEAATTTQIRVGAALTSGIVVLNDNAWGFRVFQTGDSQPRSGITNAGSIQTGPGGTTAPLQVLGSRRTGWGAPTGTATRTTFATSTVTLAQLAERVKALVDDLTTHGLIGA
jgi:hypothetical protein